MANPEVTPEEVDTSAAPRKKATQATRSGKAPKGTKGESMRAAGPVSGVETNKELSPEQREELLKTLKARFEKNMNRHPGLEWANVQAKLEAYPEKLWSLSEMERTDGEPDVVGYDQQTGEYIFYDCVPESPKARRSICYDGAGQAEREKQGVYPAGNAIGMAAAMGIELLTEEEYRELQKLGNFDTKTSSWIKTPAAIRELGGALFVDRRFNTIFVYHNTAPCFYGSRGFRGALRV